VVGGRGLIKSIKKGVAAFSFMLQPLLTLFKDISTLSRYAFASSSVYHDVKLPFMELLEDGDKHLVLVAETHKHAFLDVFGIHFCKSLNMLTISGFKRRICSCR
jgi:hypothetical protein